MRFHLFSPTIPTQTIRLTVLKQVHVDDVNAPATAIVRAAAAFVTLGIWTE
jgi:hypothetical protein